MPAQGRSALGGKKVLLITRPICPPWDEASKNFAYFLAKTVPDFEFGLLTNGIVSDLPENVRQKSIYTSNNFSYLQKIRLIKNLRKIKNDYDILHYIFTPTKQNSFLIKHFVNYKKNKDIRIIQTIATLREDLYGDSSIKDLIFGDLIITYSDYARNKLNSLGFNNVKRVYPGINLDLYKKTPKDKKIQGLFGVSDDDFVLQYAGGEYSRLGAIDDIVSLIIKYSDEFKKRKIVVFLPGRMKNKKDFEKKKEIKKIIKEASAENIVRYSDEIQADSQSRDPDWMSRVNNISDIILFPVRNMKGKFDIPLFVPEAMACEKTVIISDLPILGELSNGKNSVIIPKGDVPSLARAIFDLFDNKEKREEIGKEARKFVEENFDIKNIAEIYRQIYEKL